MELKTLQRLVRRQPVEVSPERGGRESVSADRRANTRCRLIPANWLPTGLSLSQVEQALAREQHQCRRRIHRARRAGVERTCRGPDANYGRHRLPRWSKCRTALRCACAISASWCRLPRCGSDNWARPSASEDGTVINDDDVVEGIVLLRKGAEAETTLDALHEKIAQLNDQPRWLCPPGVKLVPHLDRSDLVHYTTHTVLRNLTDGVFAGHADPVSVPRQCAQRADRSRSRFPSRCSLPPSCST